MPPTSTPWLSGGGGREYADPDTFERITHYTASMRAILDDIEAKVRNGTGSSLKHIETPFGGGKTHTMIAAWHGAAKWQVGRVAIVGTKMSADDTVWGEMERQLVGSVKLMKDMTSPGGRRIRELLEAHQPCLILIDELMEYMVKAVGKNVGDGTLAGQTVAFVQELAEEVSLLDNVCVVASFPASAAAYEPNARKRATAEQMLRSLRKVAGRKDHSVAPIAPEDVPNVIRSRLFSTPDRAIRENAAKVVDDHASFCHSRGILAGGETRKSYAERFRETFPFTPDVIDALYGQWGTFDTFQRTRGVLRLLSLVLHEIKDNGLPFVTLADFDLANGTIRRELIKHIETIMDSVITNDITGKTARARQAANEGLGVRCATAIFMNSFNKDGGQGASANDIKRSVSMCDGTQPIDAGDTLEQLQRKLHYMKKVDNRYKFTSKPNINMMREDAEIGDNAVDEAEKSAVRRAAGRVSGLDVLVWPDSLDVVDEAKLQLAIMPTHNMDEIRCLMEKRGTDARSYRNGVMVLCPFNAGKLHSDLREALKVRKVLDDHKDLPDSDRKMLNEDLAKLQRGMGDNVLATYTSLYVCGSDGPQKVDTDVGGDDTLAGFVMRSLKKADLVHPDINPDILKTAYPKQTDADSLFNTLMRTPGAWRPVGADTIKQAMSQSHRKPDIDQSVVIREPTGRESDTTPNIESDGNVTAVTATLSVRAGRDGDIARLIAEAKNAGFDVRVRIKLDGASMQKTAYGRWRDLAEDIDPAGRVDAS